MDAVNRSGPAAPREGTGANSESPRPKNTATRRRAQPRRARPASRRNGATPQQSRREDRTTPKQQREEAWETCKDLARQPRILDCLVNELQVFGVVGEWRAAKLIYMVLTSRLLDKPISAAIKGPSSVGKSYLADKVLSFFPASATYRLSGMSERALAYSEEPLKHRTLVVAEAAGLAGGVGAYFMRSLISEGQLRYETVESGPGGLKPRVIEREGPTNLLVTTTALHLDKEMETRLLSIPVDDSREQTKAIMRAQAKRHGSAGPVTDPDLSPWVALQTWLGLSERRVVIPYADKLVEAIPPVALRLRRDVSVIFGMIEAHAILHQATRERDAQGKIIATIDDYAVVRELTGDLVATAAGLTVPGTVRETVDTVRSLAKKLPFGVPLRLVAEELGLDKSAASRRAKAAIALGYLRNEEERRGMPARYLPNEPLPEEVEILPPPEALSENCCSVAPTNGGTGASASSASIADPSSRHAKSVPAVELTP